MAYKSIGVKLPGGLFCRTLFYRQHSVSKGDDVSSNTLFVTNLPPNCTAFFLSSVFSVFGDVVEVDFGSVERDGSSVEFARVQMDDRQAVQNAVAGTEEPVELPVDDDDDAPPVGVEKWERRFKASRPAPEVLEGAVGQFLVDFNTAEEEERAALEAKGEIVDEDGFILVTRRGSKRTSSAGGTSMPVATSEAPKVKRKKEGEKIDFYRFQQRQRRREEIAELRTKFEKDKLKIAKLRAQRTFRPF